MDLFDVLDADRRMRASDALERLNTAVMSQTTSADAYRKYVGTLQRQAGVTGEEKATFDEAAFMQMKMQLKAGR